MNLKSSNHPVILERLQREKLAADDEKMDTLVSLMLARAELCSSFSLGPYNNLSFFCHPLATKNGIDAHTQVANY